MSADVEAEHLQLGPHPLGTGHLGEPGGHPVLRRVAQIQRELHVDRRDGRRRLGLAGGELANSGSSAGIGTGTHRPDSRLRAGRPAAASPGGPERGTAPGVELGDLQQQITTGDLASTANRHR